MLLQRRDFQILCVTAPRHVCQPPHPPAWHPSALAARAGDCVLYLVALLLWSVVGAGVCLHLLVAGSEVLTGLQMALEPCVGCLGLLTVHARVGMFGRGLWSGQGA